MTKNDLTKHHHNWVAEFNISDTELDRILDCATDFAEFVEIWQNHDFWTDEKNGQHNV